VDSSRTALQSGKENYSLNGFANAGREFANFTTKEYCRQFAKRSRKLERQNEKRNANKTDGEPPKKAKQQMKFDMVIVDPSPPPKSDETKSAEQRLEYYGENYKYILPILKDGGLVLLSCHCKVVATITL
jgi:23S rRNA G2069 N7-methylase RlmK/C1962 C5-methylase RlmI